MKATALDNNIRIDVVAAREVHTRAIRREVIDLAHLKLEEAVEAGNEGHVRHRDRVVRRFQQPILPAIWRPQASVLVTVLPTLEADHVARLAGQQILVQGTEEGDHVDPLGACGPIAAAEQRHVLRSVLDCRPHVLEGERAGSDHQHPLVPELGARHLVAVPVEDLTAKLIRLRPVDLSLFANATVHVEAHRFGMDRMLNTSLDVLGAHVVFTVV
mmetsp:Transcript_63354/g.162982  ORF Transcript_63354/g.162982 Transcript_63354/m.162982 type:complete len:215 (+) Transcript_63354:595-1239(+)